MFHLFKNKQYKIRRNYPTKNILELLASGMSHKEILEDYEDLESEDLYACMLYRK